MNAVPGAGADSGPEPPPQTEPTRPAQPGPLTAGAEHQIGGAALGGGHPPAPDTGDLIVRRPRSLDARELGYTPRTPVPWLNPILLAGTAVRVVLAELFGAYLDKRELQSVLPKDLHDEAPEGRDELWLDYVADLGDGFDATYSVAYLLAQPHLEVDGERLPRAEVLVMGGDQVYPTASGQQYEDRFKGPYRSALPAAPPHGSPPTMYALPGNHDWYDGLTAFLRLFVQGGTTHVGGWRTRQHRSYFALRLPHRWWLFAIDVQFGAYIDEPQLHYFRQIAAEIGPDDRVILCPPAPNWVETDVPNAYDTIDYFVRKILTPTGADLRLMIAGDLHHYARYSHPERQLITCGGGGAYLYGTHRLPKRIEVPAPPSPMRNASPTREYIRQETYPTRSASWRMAAGVFHRTPMRNIGFVGLLGVTHLLLMLAYTNAMQRLGGGVTQNLVTIPLGVMVLVVLGGTVAFATPTGGSQRRLKHWALGTGHGAAHLALGYAGAKLWLALPLFDLGFPWALVAAAVTYLPVVALAANVVVGGYLLLASLFDVNVNELFAAQGIDNAKCFLRMHIDSDGSLTVYPIALDKVCREWTANVDGARHEPWIMPATPLRYRLAEPKIPVR